MFNIQGRLPTWVKLPCSAALPFGAFEAVLQQPENAATAAAVQKLVDVQQPSPDQLEQLRSAVQDLHANAHLQDEVKAAFQQSGLHLLPHNVSAAALLVMSHRFDCTFFLASLPFTLQYLCYNRIQFLL